MILYNIRGRRISHQLCGDPGIVPLSEKRSYLSCLLLQLNFRAAHRRRIVARNHLFCLFMVPSAGQLSGAAVEKYALRW